MKIILIDYPFFLHAGIFSYNRGLQLREQNPTFFVPPAVYTTMSMFISSLKKIGINSEDKIILALEGGKSWRKEVEKEYKRTREIQKERAKFINWEKEYDKQNELLDSVEDNLLFFIIKIETLEADDIIAYATEFFKDYECIIVSPDHDFDQLLVRDNVKIFSPHPHKSVRKCPYRILDLDREKEIDKAYKSLMKKIEKEKTDDLVGEILTELDYDKREQCVKLLELPEFVKEKVKPILENIMQIEKENFNPEVFSPGIQKQLENLYSQDNVISYEKCREKFAKILKKKRRINEN